MNEPLQAVSTVIELKPDKKYLLVFKGDDIDANMLNEISQHLRDMGIVNLSISIAQDIDMEVIEAPNEE